MGIGTRSDKRETIPERQSGTSTHIAFFGFRGGAGGISNVMLNLINTSSSLVRRVDVLLNNPDIPELEMLAPEVRVVRLSKRPEGPSAIWSLKNYMERAHPKVILTNRERANRTLALATLFSHHRPKMVFRVGMPITTALKRRGPIKRFLRQKAITWSYGKADLIIANSKKVAEDVSYVTGISPKKIKVLKNPTISPRIYELSMANCPHRWLREPSDLKVILAIGRLARQKDLPTLIRAFSLVLKEEREARLIILGEGKERGHLEGLVEELGLSGKVDLPGFTHNPFSYLARASCFVLSSAWEGSPNVLIEALSLGVPSVATDCPTGPREILGGGKYGPLVRIGAPEEMAKAILDTLRHPPPRERLKEAVAPYHADVATKAYLETIGLIHG